jgi:hypothetical protein
MSPMTVVASGALVAMANATSAAAASATAYLAALGLTLLVEVPVYAVLARLFAWVSWPLALVAAVVVNLLTHPILYAVALTFDSWWQLMVAETIVTGVEALLIGWAWRRHWRADWAWLCAGALVTNTLSVLAGLVLLPGLPAGA